ncbi:MAG: putative entry exclusion protein TrbK-alt [Methylocystis sp.]
MRSEHMMQPQDVGFIAFGVVIGAIAVVAMQTSCEMDVAARSPSTWTGVSCASSALEPSDQELARCRNLPPEKADDPTCRELWAKQRRRFLAPGRPPEGSVEPLDLFPTAPKTQGPVSPPPGGHTPKGE